MSKSFDEIRAHEKKQRDEQLAHDQRERDMFEKFTQQVSPIVSVINDVLQDFANVLHNEHGNEYFRPMKVYTYLSAHGNVDDYCIRIKGDENGNLISVQVGKYVPSRDERYEYEIDTEFRRAPSRKELEDALTKSYRTVRT